MIQLEEKVLKQDSAWTESYETWFSLKKKFQNMIKLEEKVLKQDSAWRESFETWFRLKRKF